MRKVVLLLLMAITFYLETGEEWGGYVIQQDFWKAKDGRAWVGRNGAPPEEMGPNPIYLYTRFCTGTNQNLIPIYKGEPHGRE